MVQLAIEYDPQPPFDSGGPRRRPPPSSTWFNSSSGRAPRSRHHRRDTMSTPTITADTRTQLRAAWAAEIAAASTARANGDRVLSGPPRTRPHPQPAAGRRARAHTRRHVRRRAPPPRPSRARRPTVPDHRRRTGIADRQYPSATPAAPTSAPSRRCLSPTTCGRCCPTPWRHREPPHARYDDRHLFDRRHRPRRATRPGIVALDDGDTYELRIAPVAKSLGDDRVRMLSYNGSIPGPTLRVRQGSEVVVHVRNDGDTDATVHWHGLRLDNAYDGVPFETQSPIAIGGEFTYRHRFPDAGLYWYHPHIREDYGLEMGLYGNIVVDPADARLLAGSRPRNRRHARRRPRRGRPHRSVPRGGPDARRDGPLRQRHADRRRDEPRARRPRW